MLILGGAEPGGPSLARFLRKGWDSTVATRPLGILIALVNGHTSTPAPQVDPVCRRWAFRCLRWTSRLFVTKTGGSKKRRISATGRLLLPSPKETSCLPVYLSPIYSART